MKIKIFNLLINKELKITILLFLLFSDSLLATQKTNMHAWLSPENEGLCFVSIGRLAKQKIFSIMIKAYSEVLKDYDVRLVIIGDGYLKDELNNEISSLGLEDNIALVGHSENPYPLLAAADGFLLSSVEEAFGLVLVEALILGVPIVSTDAIGGGPREILCDGEFGIITANNSPRDFAEGIKLLCSDRNLREKFKKMDWREQPTLIQMLWVKIGLIYLKSPIGDP